MASGLVFAPAPELPSTVQSKVPVSRSRVVLTDPPQHCCGRHCRSRPRHLQYRRRAPICPYHPSERRRTLPPHRFRAGQDSGSAGSGGRPVGESAPRFRLASFGALHARRWPGRSPCPWAAAPGGGARPAAGPGRSELPEGGRAQGADHHRRAQRTNCGGENHHAGRHRGHHHGRSGNATRATEAGHRYVVGIPGTELKRVMRLSMPS